MSKACLLLIAGSIVAPVTSLNLKQRPTLHVITPCYSKHIIGWTRLVTSALSANETIDGNQCGFGKTIWTTVVSDEQERKLLQEQLTNIETLNLTGRGRIDRIQIKTLEEVMRSTRAVDQRDLPKVLGMLTNPNNGHKLKHPIQASKKFYGCLDSAGVQVNGSEANARDVCILVDAESVVLRNSFCHMATVYMKKKTVFIAPDSNKSRNFGNSRYLLGLQDADDEQVGVFYAMESYHWFFEVRHLQHFVQRVSIPRLLLNGLLHEADVFYEEVYYHFLYPHREALGYEYVDADGMLKNAVGDSTFQKMDDTEPTGHAILEMATAKLDTVSVDAGRAIGRALQHFGVLMSRCQQYDLDQVQALMEPLDLCCSAYCTGKVC